MRYQFINQLWGPAGEDGRYSSFLLLDLSYLIVINAAFATIGDSTYIANNDKLRAMMINTLHSVEYTIIYVKIE